MSAGALLESFLAMMVAERGASQNTIENYQRDLEQFFAMVPISDMKNITDKDVFQYVQALSRMNYAPKSIARKISALKEFFKFLFSEKEIKENPTAYLMAPKQEKPLPKFLSESELKCLTDTALSKEGIHARRLAVMLILMSACGLRVSELVGLPENCINFDKKEILVKGKGSKERLIPISDEAMEAVLDYTTYRDNFIRGGRKSIWLFPSLTSSSGHMTREAFFMALKELAAEAGISPEKISPHILRHTFATRLLNHDADLRSVQKMLGHEDISTTEIYTHITSEKLIDTVKRLHPLSRLK